MCIISTTSSDVCTIDNNVKEECPSYFLVIHTYKLCRLNSNLLLFRCKEITITPLNDQNFSFHIDELLILWWYASLVFFDPKIKRPIQEPFGLQENPKLYISVICIGRQRPNVLRCILFMDNSIQLHHYLHNLEIIRSYNLQSEQSIIVTFQGKKLQHIENYSLNPRMNALHCQQNPPSIHKLNMQPTIADAQPNQAQK